MISNVRYINTTPLRSATCLRNTSTSGRGCSRFATARPDKQMVGQLAPPAERTSAVAPRDALSQLDVGISPYIVGPKRSREPRYPFRFRALFGTLSLRVTFSGKPVRGYNLLLFRGSWHVFQIKCTSCASQRLGRIEDHLEMSWECRRVANMVRILFNDSPFQWFVLWVQTGPKIDPQTGPGGFWKRVVEAPLNQVGSEFPLAAFTGPLLQPSRAFLGLQLFF